MKKTNHDHLGKIITYASGKDANYIVWIVKKARNEHRQAIDWLNEHTDTELNFFLIEMELWQIDDSALAPKFQIVCQPNDWTKMVKETYGAGETTELKTKQGEFWDDFNTYCKQEKVDFNFKSSILVSNIILASVPNTAESFSLVKFFIVISLSVKDTIGQVTPEQTTLASLSKI